MKDNTQLKTLVAPKGIYSIKSGVFFAIALIAGNVIFTIVALILDFLSEPLRLVLALITSITMIVYIYIGHYHNFTYGNKSNKLNLNGRSGNFFALFRSQGTFAIILIILLYTIRTIVVFWEANIVEPLSHTVTLNPITTIPDNTFNFTINPIHKVNQDISYGGPLYVYPDIQISGNSYENPVVNSNWSNEVAIKVTLAGVQKADSNVEALTVGLNYLCLVQEGKVNGVLLTLYPSKEDHSFIVNGLNKYGEGTFSIEWNNLLHLTVQAKDNPSLKWIGFLQLGCNNTLDVDNGVYDVSWMYYVDIPKLPVCNGFDDVLCKVR